MGADLTRWAAETAEGLLSPLGRRWQHVKAVARLADVVGVALGPGEHGTLRAAALLHDVGYAPTLAVTGFHPLDGGRFVRDQGYEEISRLVAHHSGARYEATLRGFHYFEDEFPFLDSALDQALTYCDLTTSPAGDRVTLEERVQEIAQRYGAEHTVSRAVNACFPEFERARQATEARMANAGIEVSGSLAYPR